MCKKCKKAFRKDMSEYEEADEFCPHCDNQYVSGDLMRAIRRGRGGGCWLVFESLPRRCHVVASGNRRVKWH